MNNTYIVKEDFLSNFPPILRKNIDYLLKNSSIGLSPGNGNVKILPILSKTTEFYDYFKLEVNYAGRNMNWDIIFNNEDYEFGPDFLFRDEEFLNSPDIFTIQNHIPSLANWNIKDKRSLTKVIKEILTYYKTLQIESLKGEIFYKIYEEYQTLSSIDMNNNDMEILIDNGNNSVRMLFKIKIEKFENLPPCLRKDALEELYKKENPGKPKAVLNVTYTCLKPDLSKIQSKLYVSPCIEYAIGDPVNLHIPFYDKNSTLAEYITKIKKLLNDRLEQVCEQHKLKNEYVSYLLSKLGDCILEYDNRLFKFVSLLIKLDDFFAIILIKIGNEFPREKPQICFKSCNQLTNKPLTMELKDYRYSPRWKPMEMVDRLISEFDENLMEFKKLHEQVF